MIATAVHPGRPGSLNGAQVQTGAIKFSVEVSPS
jgi:hypothetical protein